MGTQQKKKKRTTDTRVGLVEVKRTQDLDANKLALQPIFNFGHSPTGVGMIDFVNVTDTIDLAQTNVPTTPQLLMHLDGTYYEASNGLSPDFSLGQSQSDNGFAQSSAFGSGSWQCNYPTDGSPGRFDRLIWLNDSRIQMNTSVGFSVSFWIYPQDMTAAGPARRTLITKVDDATNKWSITFDSSGIIYFNVQKAGTDYKRQKSGLVAGSWQHIVAVFNGVSNTVELYLNAVAGTTTAAGTQYSASGITSLYLGYQDDSRTNTHYEGYYDELQYYQVVLTPTQVTNLMINNNT